MIDVIPTANPDGYEARTRNNARDVDLNRGFPDRLGSNGTMARVVAVEQPEVTALADLARDQPAVAGAAMHEGALVANYPYDGTPDGTTRYARCPDDAAFRALARAYADAHPRMHLPSNAEFRATLGITNGAQWYPIYGSLQDYDYVAAGTFEITLELSEHKWPSTKLLPGLYAENEASMLELPRRALLGGVRGTVKATPSGVSAATPFASAAALRILLDGSPTRSVYHPATGLFARPAEPGEHTLVVEAEGYETHRQTLAVPEDGSGVTVDVVLAPVSVQAGADAEPRVVTGSGTQAEANAVASAEAQAEAQAKAEASEAGREGLAAEGVAAAAAAEKAAGDATGVSTKNADDDGELDVATAATEGGVAEVAPAAPDVAEAGARVGAAEEASSTMAANASAASGAGVSAVKKLTKLVKSSKLEKDDPVTATDTVPLGLAALTEALGRKGSRDSAGAAAKEGVEDPTKGDALRLADESSDLEVMNNSTLLSAALARAAAEDAFRAGTAHLGASTLLIGAVVAAAALFWCIFARRLRRGARSRRLATGPRSRP